MYFNCKYLVFYLDFQRNLCIFAKKTDSKQILLSQVGNCLEGNTMSNRGAYSTKERMPSDSKRTIYNKPERLYLIGFLFFASAQQAKASRYVLPSRQGGE